MGEKFTVLTNGWQSWDKCEETLLKSEVISSGVLVIKGEKQSVLVGTTNRSKLIVLRGKLEEITRRYAKKIGVFKKDKLRIYSSWPIYGKTVTAQKMYEEAGKLKNKVEVFLVDDGWQRGIGDWEVKSNFGEDLEIFSHKVKQMGFVPGIWVAPFLVSSVSDFYKSHKDWVLKGRKLILGMTTEKDFWPRQVYALDPEKKEVKKYFYELGKKLWGMGFRFFKLDYLYVGVGDYYRDCIKAFKRGAGRGAKFLGCGAPIFESIGIFDYIRGSDDSSYYPFPILSKLGFQNRKYNSSLKSFLVRKKIFGGTEWLVWE